ncbi:MAG: hypothetical protein ACD_12C00106G0003 [uncultured bacterium]|nr:MAG: hypothetical protein ACD_12C00106G0003 [uncultured bacterium]
MILKLLNLFLVDRALAIDVLPNSAPIGVPTAFVGSNNSENLSKIIGFVFTFAIAISGGIFVIMLLVGGITYLTGAGNDEQTGKGKKMMIDAVIGIFIVLISWAIGTYILVSFGYQEPKI